MPQNIYTRLCKWFKKPLDLHIIYMAIDTYTHNTGRTHKEQVGGIVFLVIRPKFFKRSLLLWNGMEEWRRKQKTLNTSPIELCGGVGKRLVTCVVLLHGLIINLKSEK